MLATVKKLLHLALILFVACPSITSFAADCEPDTQDCIEVGEWSFGLATGLGGRSNPLRGGDTVPFILLPSFSYYNESFFIENLDIGFTLQQSESWMLNLLASPSYDRVYFENRDFGNLFVDISSFDANPTMAVDPGGSSSDVEQLVQISVDDLSRRKFSYLGGVEVSRQYQSSQLQLSLLTDLTNVHQGQEIRFAWATDFNRKQWLLTLGLTWKSSQLTDYYYGIAAGEIADSLTYKASDSLNPFLRVSWKQQSDTDDNWRFSLELQKLDSSISESPVVEDDLVISVFFGKQFYF